MNNKEILEIKKLREEKEEIRKKFKIIKFYMKNYKDSFHYKESLEAIDKNEKYMQMLMDRIKEIDIFIDEYAKVLSTNCHHRIMVYSILKYECPICKMKYQYEKLFPDTVEFVIDNINYEEERDIIDNIVMNGENKDLVEQELIDYFTELQYRKNVKVRRRTK